MAVSVSGYPVSVECCGIPFAEARRSRKWRDLYHEKIVAGMPPVPAAQEAWVETKAWRAAQGKVKP